MAANNLLLRFIVLTPSRRWHVAAELEDPPLNLRDLRTINTWYVHVVLRRCEAFVSVINNVKLMTTSVFICSLLHVIVRVH